jgi:hypothetical protein
MRTRNDQVTKPAVERAVGHLIVSRVWTRDDQVTKPAVECAVGHLIVSASCSISGRR